MTPDGAETGQGVDSGLDVAGLRRRRKIVATFSLLALLLGATAVAAYHFLRPRPVDLHQVVAVAEKTVESAIGPDYRCVFPLFEELDVAARQNDEYVVTGWVQMVDRDGHSKNSNFQCTVVPGRNAGWIPGSLHLSP